jgi:hypothetical protein
VRIDLPPGRAASLARRHNVSCASFTPARRVSVRTGTGPSHQLVDDLLRPSGRGYGETPAKGSRLTLGGL